MKALELALATLLELATPPAALAQLAALAALLLIPVLDTPPAALATVLRTYLKEPWALTARE
jgi:hypothetical protein